MARTSPLAMLCIGLALLAPTAISAQPRSVAVSTIPAPNLVEVQWPGWSGGPGYSPKWAERREHCDRLRHASHEIGERIRYAPPWERGRMETRMYEVRERLRHECWRGW